MRTPSIKTLRTRAANCRNCDLWKNATQTVFGEGPQSAEIFLLGEQPGDAEDVSGHPFVGPAGQLLRRALNEAGVDWKKVYVTNVVKHFKFLPRGKRRMHQRANAAEQAACRHWLDAELNRIKPRRIVCLGATAANAIFGRKFQLMKQRGKWIELESGEQAMVTVHPSYILRVRDDDRKTVYGQFVDDLRKIAKA